MAFSLTLIPTCAQIYNHWASMGSDGRVYLLKAFALPNQDNYVALIYTMNNILDWGLDARLTSISRILHKSHALTAEKGDEKRKRSKCTGGSKSQSSHERGEEFEGEED